MVLSLDTRRLLLYSIYGILFIGMNGTYLLVVSRSLSRWSKSIFPCHGGHVDFRLERSLVLEY